MEDETVETATDGISLGKKEVLQTEVQHFAARLSRRLWTLPSSTRYRIPAVISGNLVGSWVSCVASLGLTSAGGL